tara:strand:- start:660 stop:977 length:318 start_codon:yes stop_codon:yes gene_type:complete
MISYFKVKKESMTPFIKEGDFVLAERMSYLFSSPGVGHVVIVRHPRNPNTLLIKRIVRKREREFWIEGDNTLESTDSRHFGWISNDSVMGKVIHKTGPLALDIMN